MKEKVRHRKTYIERESKKERERKRESKTKREREREREKDQDKEREREREREREYNTISSRYQVGKQTSSLFQSSPDPFYIRKLGFRA